MNHNSIKGMEDTYIEAQSYFPIGMHFDKNFIILYMDTTEIQILVPPFHIDRQRKRAMTFSYI